jgi:hypothetical protein
MNAVQAAGAQPACTTLAVNPGFFELLKRDHAMLPGGDSGDDGIRAGLGAFCIHGDA